MRSCQSATTAVAVT